MGNFATAVEVLDMAALDAGEDAPRRAHILADRALALGGLDHHEEAIEEARKALELAPQSAIVNHVMGFVLNLAGRPSEAVEPIEKALELDPSLTQALRTLAIVKAVAGKNDEAIEILKRALQRNPMDSGAILQLSVLYIDKGEHAQAVDLLAPYLQATPQDVRALNNQGLALRGLKRFDDAHKVLKRASRLKDGDPLILTNLGQAEARPLHEEALRSLPGDARLLANYGMCLAALGETDRARETLDAALAANPDNAEALEARAKLDA
jgi:tetratricopeptide (TPR) repeat protein